MDLYCSLLGRRAARGKAGTRYRPAPVPFAGGSGWEKTRVRLAVSWDSLPVLLCLFVSNLRARRFGFLSQRNFRFRNALELKALCAEDRMRPMWCILQHGYCCIFLQQLSVQERYEKLPAVAN
jgi:hypothetical protein